jgi:hypothetical protein
VCVAAERAEYWISDNSEQIADNRRPVVWVGWVECGSIGWCGDVRKSGSLAPALKSRIGHLKVAATGLLD